MLCKPYPFPTSIGLSGLTVVSSGKEYQGKVKKALIILLLVFFTTDVSEVSLINGNNY